MPAHITSTAPIPSSIDVAIVGAGLAGLSAARHLERQGLRVHLFEASDAVGGRIRTDEVDGFVLDRGFQVLLTAYEEVQEDIDLRTLDVKPFGAGSLVWREGGLQRMTDPVRDPSGAFASARARVGTLRDKLKVAALRTRLLSKPPEDCFRGPERSTLEELRALGFSEGFIDGFFRPFLGGVFLERKLDTSASLFRYYFRCFAAGEAGVPARGMQRLPEQLAQPLLGRISYGARVVEVRPGGLTLDGGHAVLADEVIVAADGAGAASLLGTPVPAFKATVTSYFAAPEAPTEDPLLVLDGVGEGPVNHLAVMSNVSAAYAPAGMHLVSVSGVGAAADDADAFATAAPGQLRRWFGASCDRWTHLRSYRIPHALPRHPPHSLSQDAPVRRPDGLIVAGDYSTFGSIQGALRSGRRAAELAMERRAEGAVC